MSAQNRPNSIDITVGPGGIIADQKQPKVWGSSGGHITFNIINGTGVDQHVRIPPVEIVPSPIWGADATPFPLLSGRYSVTVAPGRTEQIVMNVKSADYFPWQTKKWHGNPIAGMTYKYTVYSNEHFLDPDLEINP
jgi:hypothetical protein